MFPHVKQVESNGSARSPAMNHETAQGVWKDGHVILDQPVRWPEGCRVAVEPLPKEAAPGHCGGRVAGHARGGRGLAALVRLPRTVANDPRGRG